MSFSHKSGQLKQANKKHKSGNATKRSVKRDQGNGRVEALNIKATHKERINSKSRKGQDLINARANRLNRGVQIRKQKKADSEMLRRLGTPKGAPKIVGIIGINEYANVLDALDSCLVGADWSSQYSISDFNEMRYAKYNKHKARCAFIHAVNAYGDVAEALDIAKVADILVVVAGLPMTSAIHMDSSLIDDRGVELISTLKSVGCPELICGVQNGHHLDGKPLVDSTKVLQAEIEMHIGSDTKVMELHKTDLLCRQLCTTVPRQVNWRKERTFLLADAVEAFVSEDGLATVHLKGYLRGQSLALNSLMHIVGAGTGRVQKVRGVTQDPFYVEKKSGDQAADMSEQEVELYADLDKQDPLELFAEGDGVAGEQTWPTEEEMNAAVDEGDEGAGRLRRNVPHNIPNGMSHYQADWFVDEDGELEGDVADNGKDSGTINMAGDDDDDSHQSEDDFGEDDTDNMTVGDTFVDVAQDAASANAEKERLRHHNEDSRFPDEVDAPLDRKACERFARYRALDSFRSTYWHPKENLPHEYSSIFQFQNFSSVQKRISNDIAAVEGARRQDSVVTQDNVPFAFRMPISVDHGDEADGMKEAAEEEDGDVYIAPDSYVEIVLNGLPADIVQNLTLLTKITAFGLQEHENRLSVLHFVIKRHASYDGIIKSKDELTFVTGFRSFKGKPIFSESNLNSDKHKMERFLMPDRFSVASVYGPISYLPCPLLVFKELPDGNRALVATGSLLKVDPDRIMLKKVVLTGLPIRVRKRLAVVKHMFYHTQDVRWYKPATLYTKHGLRGHIKEPVGTHGLLKAVFSAPINQNDTIMLTLYKRVYPKLPAGGVQIL